MKEFELSDQDLKDFFEAVKPMPVMYLPGGVPMFRSPQERANDEWKRLGKKYGFKWDTVQPVPGKGQRFILAEEIKKEEHDADPSEDLKEDHDDGHR